MVESDFGGAGPCLMKLMLHRVVDHSLGAKCSYKIVIDDMSRQPLQMETEDD
jgi:hypothetical protein